MGTIIFLILPADSMKLPDVSQKAVVPLHHPGLRRDYVRKPATPLGLKKAASVILINFTAGSRASCPFLENENSHLGSTLCLPITLIRIHFLVLLRAKSLQSRLTLCDPTDCSMPGFSRQEHWNGLPFPPPGDLPDSEIEPPSQVFGIGRWVLYH